jgi:CheY-like chemotaxis protein
MNAPKRVVLLVDGHADSRAVYRAVLEHDGYTVLEASDGVAGWELAHLVRPDVIVTEVKLPDGGKLEFLRRLKADPKTCDVRVLIVTAQVFDSVRAEARELGCVHFLSKPLEPRRLLATVREAVGAALIV